MEQVESPTVAICNGKRTILLGTYNYMGMTFDPDVIAAGKKALDEFGSGTTGSRVLNGTYGGHKAFEEALKEFYAMDHAMVFSTGYQANLGVISTIAGKEDYIVLDIDSHASIYDGCALGNAQIVPFRHNDIEALEKRLKRIPDGAGKLVILEGVYSMLGDIAPLREMVAVSKANGAMVLVDEAHSMGSSASMAAASPRLRASSTMSTSSSAPFPSRSGPSVVSASRTIRSSRFAARLPSLRLHRVASAIGRRYRRDLDPQTHGERRQAGPPVGEFEAPSRGASPTRLHARYRRTAVGDHRCQLGVSVHVLHPSS